MSAPVYQQVAHAWELEEGRGLRVEVAGHAVALFRIAGRIHAVGDACPHRGASLGEEGHVDERGHLVCVWHQWRFDPESGRHLGPADACLAVYPVRVDGDRVLIAVTPG